MRTDLAYYETLQTSLTLNLRVRDIGAVISLLADAGYEVEVNVAQPQRESSPSAS